VAMNGKQIVLITGGSSGIGKSMAEYLSTKEYIVYGTSRNPGRFKDFKAFKLLTLDVNSPESIQEAIAYIIKKHRRIDILINNAGVGITGPIEETPESAIKNAFETNYFGPIRMIKAVLPEMRNQKSGLIINITSIAGYMGLPYRGVYSATKSALEMTTEAFRMEIKDFGVQMTNVAPGDFATNIASGRYHAPLLEDSPYHTSYGQTLATMDAHVDAGQDPKVMAKVIDKIIRGRKPKVHYKVGVFMQKFSIVLKRILPDKVYEKLLLNHYKL